ncbi:hypothetical protein H7X65_03885 [Candidatus Parcubacteria bacterium]|nr:hypothetical protein [Candidatus Parcubacteria bacterium]
MTLDMCYYLGVMQIIPAHKIRTRFRSKFDGLGLSAEQRMQVDVPGEVSRLLLAQKNYIDMANGQKDEHPNLATQRKIEELVQFRINKRIEEDLRGQLASAA